MLNIDRAKFIEELKNRNIGASVHFIPIHVHPYYRDKYGYKPTDYPVAYENYQRIVSLPMSAKHSDQDIDDVIEAVLDIVKEHRR
jgi:dTDP-4-amino-4,6-dideoxygalactose transaminase